MGKRNPNSAARCTVADCGRPHEAGGYCAKHYQRFKRHGDPLATRNPAFGMALSERIRANTTFVPIAGCFLWTGNVSSEGYGLISLGANRQALAHREAWKLERGPIPDGICVCHHCDVPSCINPAHLFLGTQADNMRDKFAKGRDGILKGEAAPMAKLTRQQVGAIRSDSAPAVLIAAKYGVSDSAVRHIKRGTTWKNS